MGMYYYYYKATRWETKIQVQTIVVSKSELGFTRHNTRPMHRCSSSVVQFWFVRTAAESRSDNLVFRETLLTEQIALNWNVVFRNPGLLSATTRNCSCVFRAHFSSVQVFFSCPVPSGTKVQHTIHAFFVTEMPQHYVVLRGMQTKK